MATEVIRPDKTAPRYGLRFVSLFECDGHEDLRGLSHRSIIHYVHRIDYYLILNKKFIKKYNDICKGGRKKVGQG
jgi:hypothetical protein